MRKPTLITGLALGYLLGARAGRERYEQISRTAHRIAEIPAVQSAARTGTRAAGSAAHSAAHTLVERVGHRLHPSAHEHLSRLRDRTAVHRADGSRTTTAAQ